MKRISRREFTKRLSLPAMAAVVSGATGCAGTGVISSANGESTTVLADTSHGTIRGQRTRGVNIFKGVPYAGKVSGERRFRSPDPLEPWTGVLDALEPGAPSIQPPRRNEPPPSEDCLFLNVWTPDNDNRKRPVMFYSHGGGYVGGSGSAGGQDGANLARHFDVVVVETNHRLGLLGFLYLEELAGSDYQGSGNMGMLDIVEGLRWVNENIASFGGDPNNVMIFGESGGGGKTSCLYAMPAAAPYFNKASIESGPGVRMQTVESAAATTREVLQRLGIAPADWRKLLDVPAEELLTLQSNMPNVPPSIGPQSSGIRLGFGPVVDGVALPNHPFDPTAPAISRDKPLLVGWNEDEYTFFAWQQRNTQAWEVNFDTLPEALERQYGANTQKIIDVYRHASPNATASDIFIAISSINMMGLGSVDIAEKKTIQAGAPAYLYNFGYKSEITIPGTDYALGTPHAMDISFKFNNQVPPPPGEEPRGGFGGSRPESYVASHHFAELWTTFARTGVPAAENVPDWPAYNLANRPTMRIDSTCEVINDRFSEELALWRDLGRL